MLRRTSIFEDAECQTSDEISYMTVHSWKTTPSSLQMIVNIRRVTNYFSHHIRLHISATSALFDLFPENDCSDDDDDDDDDDVTDVSCHRRHGFTDTSSTSSVVTSAERQLPWTPSKRPSLLPLRTQNNVELVVQRRRRSVISPTSPTPGEVIAAVRYCWPCCKGNYFSYGKRSILYNRRVPALQPVATEICGGLLRK